MIAVAAGLIMTMLVGWVIINTFSSIQGYWGAYNNPPVIEILSPKEGDVLNGTVEIRWIASDPDNEELIIFIDYTSDHPQLCPSCPPPTWHTIAYGIDNIGTYMWDTTKVSNGEYYIRVVASDGKTYVSKYVGIVTVNNTLT